MARIAWRGLKLGLAGLALASVARADPTTSAISVRYHAAAGCPNQAAFVAQILARTPLARRARQGEPARTIDVSIQNQRGHWVGELSVAMPDGGRAARRVTARSCADVASALALVAALSLDPQASTAALPPRKTRPAPPPSTPPPAAPASVPSRPAPRREHRPPPLWRAPLPSPPPPRRPRWTFSAGATTGLVGAIAPRVAPALRLQLGAERDARGAWAPALSVSAAAARASASNPLAPATFTWFAGRLAACPVVWRIFPQVGLRPCLGLDAGILQAQSAGRGQLESTGTKNRPWLSGDGLATASWRLARYLELRVSGGALVPFIRDDFVFQDAQGRYLAQVYQVPAIGGFFEIGLGLRFQGWK